jgi:hypothetical protein
MLAGDPDVLAGFYDARGQTVAAYCAEVCPPELVDDAALASFIDFIARIGAADRSDPDLDDLLIKGTRAAAAPRVNVERPPGPVGRILGRHNRPVDSATCRVMPELLAAFANGEFPGDEREIRRHAKSCNVCRATAARMERAEQTFASASGSGGVAPDVRDAWLRIAAAPDEVKVAGIPASSGEPEPVAVGSDTEPEPVEPKPAAESGPESPPASARRRLGRALRRLGRQH